MFTKQHYEAIAEIIHSRTISWEVAEEIRYIAIDLADYFQRDNPRFNRGRFLAACGMED